MGGNIVENSAVKGKVVSFSRRNYPSVLGNNCALFAAGRAELGHFWKAKAAVDARLHDDINRSVAWLRRSPGL